jgi:hypothetical protein
MNAEEMRVDSAFRSLANLLEGGGGPTLKARLLEMATCLQVVADKVPEEGFYPGAQTMAQDVREFVRIVVDGLGEAVHDEWSAWLLKHPRKG